MVKFSEESIRKINSYSVIKKIKEVSKREPIAVTGNHRSPLTVKVDDKEQATAIQNIQMIEEFQCTVAPHPRFNDSKGIIYIHDCDC